MDYCDSILAYIPFSKDTPPSLITSSLQTAITKFSKQILNNSPKYQNYDISKAITMSTQSKQSLNALCADAAIKRLNQRLNALCADETHTVSSAMTTTNSLKRTSEETEAEPISMRLNIFTTGKKPCLSPVGARTNTHMSTDGDHVSLLTPPETPPVSTVRTMHLRLDIPQQVVSNEESEKLKLREAAPEKCEPKFKRPFPRKRQMKVASDIKHMKHYTTNETSALSESGFIKPHINKSARVDKLLRVFPYLSTTNTKRPRYRTQAERDEARNRARLLEDNKKITKSDYAKRLAWEAFSSREKGRIDRGREAMLVSALEKDDLANEKLGVPNDLPEWRKAKTSRFARSG